MNLLKKTRAYLVGQMQYTNGQPWREYVESQLKEIGIIVLNPYNAYKLVAEYKEAETVEMDLPPIAHQTEMPKEEDLIKIIFTKKP